MEIDPNIRKQSFISSLKQGTVFRLKGDIPFESDKYHIFIVLNNEPQSDTVLLLVNGTSKVEKKLQILHHIYRDNANRTSVIIEANSYQFITKQTIIDCNEVKTININAINFNSDDFKPIVSDELSQSDIDKVINAVLNSTNVSDHIKQKIQNSHIV